MNREFYQSLNEAYASMYNEDFKQGYQGTTGKSGEDLANKVADVASEVGHSAKAYGKGFFTGKKVNSKAPMTDRAANAVGRANQLSGRVIAQGAKNLKKTADAAYEGGKWLGNKAAPYVKKGWDATTSAVGDASKKATRFGKTLWKRFTKEDLQVMVGAYLLDTGLAETPQAASAIVEHMADEYLEHLVEQVPEETVLELMEGGMFAGISDEALEKAAAASLNKHKAQGYKVPGLNAMDDVVKRINARKKGQV